MNQKSDVETRREMEILNLIELDPDATQASVAEHLGLAVGTVNWYLKRLVSEGFVKIQHCERRKMKYMITPEGLAMRGRLMEDYIHSSLQPYRLVRSRMMAVLSELEEKLPVRLLCLDGEGDVEEICRLICLERGWKCVSEAIPGIPSVHIIGMKMFPELPENPADVVPQCSSERMAVNRDALRSLSAI